MAYVFVLVALLPIPSHTKYLIASTVQHVRFFHFMN